MLAQHRVVDGAVGAVAQASWRRRSPTQKSAPSARRCPTRCGPSGRRPGPASRPAKPSGTSRAPRTATGSGRTASRRSARQHAVHGLNAVRRAQDGQGEGGVGQPVRLQRTTSTPTYSASFAHAPQKPEEAAWGSGRTP